MKRVDGDGGASAPNPAQARASEQHESELRAELAMLRTRCAELERQNDLLRRSSTQAESERDSIRQRYDTLPVACLTLTPDGSVFEGNATFATLLGLAAAPSAGVNLEAVIAVPQHVERFRDHLASVFTAPGMHCCELWLRKPDGAVTRVRLESTAVQGLERSTVRQCRSVIAEVTAPSVAGPGVRERFAPLSSMPPRAPSALDGISPALRGGETVGPPASTDGPSAGEPAKAPRAALATVLVVEDESLVRKAVQHYLTTAGYHVLTAVDRSGALAHSEQHDGAIDLILTDLSLPNGATGPEVVETIRARRPEVGVLYMTATPADMLARRGFVAQTGHTLEKPFSKETLLRRVAKELAAAAATGDGAE